MTQPPLPPGPYVPWPPPPPPGPPDTARHQQLPPGPRHAHVPPPSAPPVRRTRREKWLIAASAGGLLVVIPLIVWAATRGGPAPAAEPVTPETQTWVARPTTTPTTAPTTAPPPGPVTTITPRSEPYPVGTGGGAVAPGRYTSSGPTDDGTVCYHARLRGTGGGESDVIDSSASRPYQFTVRPTDKWVQVSGCTWTKGD